MENDAKKREENVDHILLLVEASQALLLSCELPAAHLVLGGKVRRNGGMLLKKKKAKEGDERWGRCKDGGRMKVRERKYE
jgi:hypothetical protein